MLNMRNKSEYWNETLHLALQALHANKLRAALTMVGVIIGSGCIVLVVTVALAGNTTSSLRLRVLAPIW
jgi:hypothetical protein